MELDFIDNSDYVRVSTVREVEVSVQKGPVGVTWAILVTEHAPTMNTMVSAPQCTTVLTCAPLPLQGSTLFALLLVQCTSAAVLMLVLSTFLSPGTRASITMQGPAFLPWPACQCYSRERWRRQRLCQRRYASNGTCTFARSEHALPQGIHGSSCLAHVHAWLHASAPDGAVLHTSLT